MSAGTVYGVGLGPGDPELMSVRADRLVRGAAHVAYFRKAGLAGRARGIVEGMVRPDAREHPMDYPVTTEIPFADPRYNALLSGFYAEASAHLRALAEAGEDVVVLCEGDPFFYGSFMHLHARLKDHVPVEVVPAITGMSAAWTATGAPVTWGDDVLTVLAGTLPEAELARRMAEADALVVMKIGRNLGRVRRALATAGMAERAILVEYASMSGERVTPLGAVEGEAAPYFSIIVVHGRGRRP
ncbi:precorrin-2 C(20)-methyltransferase [Xanthobacter sp. V2C-8]|uniref:precorrin-2 C(20)-methyltransferase n=1 Tax=Xanthobacter albus TaxID=3119929 RepID=UPI003728BC60